METKIFHGNITPNEVGRTLVATFNHGNLKAQKIGQGSQVVVQITTRDYPSSGGNTAMTVTIQQHEDGVAVQVGKQTWLGVAASLGKTAFFALRNPLSLLGRLDDLAQDIESLQMTQAVWDAITDLARSKGVSYALSERLRRLTCAYCTTANLVGAPQCIACGAPLGDVQPHTCPNCGFVVRAYEPHCPNCKQPLPG